MVRYFLYLHQGLTIFSQHICPTFDRTRYPAAHLRLPCTRQLTTPVIVWHTNRLINLLSTHFPSLRIVTWECFQLQKVLGAREKEQRAAQQISCSLSGQRVLLNPSKTMSFHNLTIDLSLWRHLAVGWVPYLPARVVRSPWVLRNKFHACTEFWPNLGIKKWISWPKTMATKISHKV